MEATKPRRFLLLVATCLLVFIAAVPGGAQVDPPVIVVENGLTQPVFSFANAVQERVWVESPVDVDDDGQLDRIVVDIARPLETATHNFKVPVVFEHSPYRGTNWSDPPWHQVDFDVLPSSIFKHPWDTPKGGLAYAAAQATGQLASYYVARGYAVALGRNLGTGGPGPGQSDGCSTAGDENEILSTKAVIDWFNGRARAFNAAGEEVFADWSTGNVGMIGTSYVGTLPNMVATTGVEGLKAIVPIAAISSWYNYYRQNGVPVPAQGWQGDDADNHAKWNTGQVRSEGLCADFLATMTAAQDRVTGNYNDFWAARDYLPGAKDVKAAVFVVHGRNDTNVRPQHATKWWEELSRYDVPRKIWLHNGGHGSPGNNASYTLPGGQTWTYQQTVHRWFDYWLWNVPNGIMSEPPAIVQHAPGGNQTHAGWPDPAMEEVTVRLTAGAPEQVGGLTTTQAVAPKHVKQTFVDNGRNITPTLTAERRPARTDALVIRPDEVSPWRLVYRSNVLTEPLRLSGTPKIRLRGSVDNESAATWSAYLMDYGPPGSTGAANAVRVTYGWMSAQHRLTRERIDPIKQGTMYDFEWELQPHDYVFQPGRRIGLVILSTDFDQTPRPLPGTQLSVIPELSTLTLPLVNGADFTGPYPWEGFLATFKDPPVLNTAHSNGTQKFWWRIGGDYGLDILAAGSPASRQIDCDTKEPTGPTEPAGGTLTFQESTGRYSYHWPTTTTYAGTCREFIVTLNDGNSHSTYLNFIK